MAAPLRTARRDLDALVLRRAAWIESRRAALTATTSHHLADGGTLPYLGRAVPLQIGVTARRRVTIRLSGWRFAVAVPGHLADGDRADAIRAALERWYRSRAERRLRARTERFARSMNLRPARVLVRGQRGRWGSCGRDGVIRLCWRLVMAPPALLDYVVVHELAHLRDRTHGPRYWSIVAAALPDHRERRKRLRELGPSLTL